MEKQGGVGCGDSLGGDLSTIHFIVNFASIINISAPIRLSVLELDGGTTIIYGGVIWMNSEEAFSVSSLMHRSEFSSKFLGL